MLIKRLVLKGYKRLLLRDIDYLELTLTDIHQLIVGTNGSGKTSLLAELSPLPANSGDYTKGGYKVIEIEHRGFLFTLSSTFTQHGKHSFLIHGNPEEQNPGGTITVQKELVYKHLGIDSDIVAVLNDNTTFTSMAPLKRRDWVMRLSGSDMSYAMKVFNQLKTKHRDAQGVVKHLSKRLSDEASKAPSLEEQEEIKISTEKLQKELTAIMELREPNLPPMHEVKDKLRLLINESEKDVKFIQEHPLPTHDFTSLEEVKSQIDQYSLRIKLEQEQLDKVYAQIDDIKDIVQALNKSNATGIEELRTRHKGLVVELKPLYSSVGADLINQRLEANRLLSATNAVKGLLIDVFSNIPINEEKRYSSAARELARSTLLRLQGEYDHTEKNLAKFNHRLEHIDTTDTTNCPKCGHMWKIGIEGRERENVVSKIDLLGKQRTRLLSEITDIQTILESATVYIGYVRQLTQITSNNPSLSTLWDRVSVVWNKDDPRGILNILSKWIYELGKCEEINVIESELALIANAIEHSKQDGEGKSSHYLTQMKTLEEEVNVRTTTISEFISSRNEVKSLYATLQKLEAKNGLLQTTEAELTKLINLSVRITRHELLQREISKRQLELASKEALLIKANNIAAILEDITNQRKVVMEEVDALALLLAELSPVDGLIADQLTSFITCLTEQMNAVISGIWTYPMEVIPCGLASGELDYKFPLRINGGSSGAPDISLGSKSQVAIVNFAFKLIMMLYLELDDYPLYVDELSSSLDEQHRLNIVRFIKNHIETKRCSQMFMVSHDSTEAYAFTPNQVCVLDTANIVSLPEVYNKHVVIK